MSPSIRTRSARLAVVLTLATLLAGSCRPATAPKAPATVPAAPRVVLLTGFEPFGGDAVNASWEAIRDLDGREVAGCRVAVRQLPVVWGEAAAGLSRLIEELRPAAVLAFGQGRPERFTFERVGRNARGRYPDNLGKLPDRPTLVPDGPERLDSPFPIDRVMPGLHANGLPVAVSEDAGRYLCDEAVYSLERLRRARGGFECAFFHVPPLGSKLVLSGNVVTCDREILRTFVKALIETWAAESKKAKGNG